MKEKEAQILLKLDMDTMEKIKIASEKTDIAVAKLLRYLVKFAVEEMNNGKTIPIGENVQISMKNKK